MLDLWREYRKCDKKKEQKVLNRIREVTETIYDFSELDALLKRTEYIFDESSVTYYDDCAVGGTPDYYKEPREIFEKRKKSLTTEMSKMIEQISINSALPKWFKDFLENPSIIPGFIFEDVKNKAKELKDAIESH
ncbi:MAG: hypothetical protein ABH808_01180 [Candidatus Kuenenbacteria bacterium]